jgi:hypothetical protein
MKRAKTNYMRLPVCNLKGSYWYFNQDAQPSKAIATGGKRIEPLDPVRPQTPGLHWRDRYASVFTAPQALPVRPAKNLSGKFFPLAPIPYKISKKISRGSRWSSFKKYLSALQALVNPAQVCSSQEEACEEINSELRQSLTNNTIQTIKGAWWR